MGMGVRGNIETIQRNEKKMPETDWAKVQAEFEALPTGCFFKASDGNYYIKPDQRKDFHLDTMMMELFTGKFFHFSKCTSFQQVYGFEIPW